MGCGIVKCEKCNKTGWLCIRCGKYYCYKHINVKNHDCSFSITEEDY
jgi:hypothetical protein